MKKEIFLEFWDKNTTEWIDHALCVHVNHDELIAVKKLCSFKKATGKKVYKKYISIKRTIKNCYFEKNKEHSVEEELDGSEEPIRLSKYKRAAAFAYAVLLTECFTYEEGITDKNDPYLLKQRFAFELGIQSIIQSISEYSGVDIGEVSSGIKIINFDDYNIDHKQNDDTFLQSIYKDLHFSLLFQNFNILTLANLYEALTINSSILKKYIEKGNTDRQKPKAAQEETK